MIKVYACKHQSWVKTTGSYETSAEER